MVEGKFLSSVHDASVGSPSASSTRVIPPDSTSELTAADARRIKSVFAFRSISNDSKAEATISLLNLLMRNRHRKERLYPYPKHAYTVSKAVYRTSKASEITPGTPQRILSFDITPMSLDVVPDTDGPVLFSEPQRCRIRNERSMEHSAVDLWGLNETLVTLRELQKDTAQRFVASLPRVAAFEKDFLASCFYIDQDSVQTWGRSHEIRGLIVHFVGDVLPKLMEIIAEEVLPPSKGHFFEHHRFVITEC
jgi:hypothetical protein